MLLTARRKRAKGEGAARGMKTLESWLGIGGGALGVAYFLYLSIFGASALDFTTAYVRAVPLDSPGAMSQQLFTLLSTAPFVAASVFLAAAIGGTWLDVQGRRQAGKVTLSVCAVGLLIAATTMPDFALSSRIVAMMGFFLILGATIVAYLRPEPAPVP